MCVRKAGRSAVRNLLLQSRACEIQMYLKRYTNRTNAAIQSGRRERERTRERERANANTRERNLLRFCVFVGVATFFN